MSIQDSLQRYDSEVSNLKDSKARKRLAKLFDNGTFTEIDRFLKNNQTECEVVTAYGEVNGMLVYAYAQSIEINNGAMGKSQAAKIAHVYELATKTGAPVVAVFDSNGAHVDEGLNALEAYGSLIKAAGNISGVVPQVAVVAGPCVGSAAVLASLSDVVVLTKDAELYITAPAKQNYSDIAAQNGSAAIVTENDMAAIAKRVESVFRDKTYMKRVDKSDKRWMDDEIGIVFEGIVNYLKGFM